MMLQRQHNLYTASNVTKKFLQSGGVDARRGDGKISILFASSRNLNIFNCETET